MWNTYNAEPTSMEIQQFCTISTHQSIQHPWCLAWSVHLPPPYIMLLHHFYGKYSVNTLYLYHPISAKHHSLFSIEGYSINVISMVDFGMEGELTKDYLVWAQLPHQKKIQESKPHRDSGSVWQFYPQNKVTGRAKQYSTKTITPVVNGSPGAQCKWN